MKAETNCPNCASSFSVSREKEGKRAKCPKCQQPFVIAFREQAQLPEFPPSLPSIIVPQVTAPTPKLAPETKQRRRVALPQWAIVAIPAIASLGIGYVAGREHVKYQFRSAFSQIADAFSESLSVPSPMMEDAAASEPALPVAMAQTSASELELKAEPELETAPAMKPEPEPEPPAPTTPRLGIGDAHTADGFTLSLVGVKIEQPKIKDMFGETQTGRDDTLVVRLNVANTDERKMLHYRDGHMFQTGNFILRDDVGNQVRGVSFGVGSSPIGAITDDGIPPETTASHVQIFDVPLPKTEHLILTVDLDCLGGEGSIEFQIPATAIER